MQVKLKAVVSLAGGILSGVLALLVWYSFLSPHVPPRLYRPLHHWMYGLVMLILGVTKLRRLYGQFSLSMGSILLIDDLHDFLEAVLSLVGF